MGWMSEEEAQAEWEVQRQAEEEGKRLELEGCATEHEAERKTAEEIEKALRINELEWRHGDKPYVEYERTKRELEHKLEEMKEVNEWNGVGKDLL